MPDIDPPADLLAALCRLQIERPDAWTDAVAEAVVAVGGAEAADQLALAASGYAPDDDDGDPEQALVELEDDLRAMAGVDGPNPTEPIGLPVEPPPPRSTKPPRSMAD